MTVGTCVDEAPRRWRVLMGLTTGAVVVAIAELAVVDATRLDLLAGAAGVVILLAAGLSWMILAPIGCARYRQFRTVALAPLIALVGVAAVWFGLPERAGWWLSKSAMTEAAANCRESDERWIGIIRTWSTDPDAGGCRFTTGDGTHLGGLAYFPPGTQPPDYGGAAYQPTYTRYDDNWYHFTVNLSDH
ncbi:hypothetical protein [Nocardia lasii]|uniref:DUF1109 domain-containing protein n=1 Tax=Nocardia lasii TaxID=1616107 RepID=A0ABW1JNW4_9NOCA